MGSKFLQVFRILRFADIQCFPKCTIFFLVFNFIKLSESTFFKVHLWGFSYVPGSAALELTITDKHTYS